ncbi:His/Gly/Thr/Pro-type tRNA ligase C-terminal domain-containing protein [Nannocystis pusilla]|uniref:His/Gly/Thr/Pro-type tRNA ligase C-terminal domain-containing protein n=1 Tax=Nannocystis pusilla TaxID=889268 RepID=A0A9X3ET49_9BACT|nr:His/Gly/Thr/Pro-type tRNA ligase C-terminal domain-containing protein [Nannocystis pusilla]MCY1006051.1 His/Gly/Thr/Pro-type tRNA ligase C-terminal domain-containing protein [Nannocystis pusilla]
MLGSLERFFGVYLEHVAGRFPTWLAPVQVAILPITAAHHAWAGEVEAALVARGLRVHTDLRNEKLGLKIREATLLRVPTMLVLGDKEVEGRGSRRAPATVRRAPSSPWPASSSAWPKRPGSRPEVVMARSRM